MRLFGAARLSLLWKILLSTSVALTALFAAVAWIVQDHVIRTAWASVEDEIQSSLHTYESLWQARAEKLKSISLILSTMSDVRAAFGTRDQATIRDTAGELWAKVSEQDALFLVTDPRGKVIASLGGAPESPLDEGLPVVEKAGRRFPQQVTGFLLRGGGLYQIVITPVYVQSAQGQALLNVLVAGYRIDALFAQQFKESAGGSEFVFEAGGRVFASTLNPRATGVLLERARQAGDGHRLSDDINEYSGVTKPLIDIDGERLGELWILRSFDRARSRITALARSMFLIWFVALCAGLGLTYLLARRIVAPVNELDRAAAELARQNYGFRVREESQDELGRLARTFNTMSASIQAAQAEIIRQERISTIGRLSSSIVHDLRNPLAAIYGGAEMLVDADLPPGQVKRLAGSIYRASRRIQELLQDLVNVSRGKSRPAEACRLKEVVIAAVEGAASAAEHHRVQIREEVPDTLELPLERARIERVLLNLLGNAVEAMPNGGQVRITARESAGAVVIRVEDNGPGIPLDVRAHLFEPFFSSGKKNGLGLGLALSRQTVLDHGGDIWVEPRETGACFAIRLPLAGGTGAAERPLTASAQ